MKLNTRVICRLTFFTCLLSAGITHAQTTIIKAGQKEPSSGRTNGRRTNEVCHQQPETSDHCRYFAAGISYFTVNC